MNELFTDDNGEIGSGAPIGFVHKWNYTEARWNEEKTSRRNWLVDFTSVKRKRHPTGYMGDFPPGTEFHWVLFGDQYVKKLDADSYETHAVLWKSKVAHKRPYWKAFSNEYENNKDNALTERDLRAVVEEWIKNVLTPKKCIYEQLEEKMVKKSLMTLLNKEKRTEQLGDE